MGEKKVSNRKDNLNKTNEKISRRKFLITAGLVGVGISGGVLYANTIGKNNEKQDQITLELSNDPLKLTKEDDKILSSDSREIINEGLQVFLKLQESDNFWIKSIFSDFNEMKNKDRVQVISLNTISDPRLLTSLSSLSPSCNVNEGITRANINFNFENISKHIEVAQLSKSSIGMFKIYTTDEIFKQLAGLSIVKSSVLNAKIGNCNLGNLTTTIESSNGFPNPNNLSEINNKFNNYGKTYNLIVSSYILQKLEGRNGTMAQNILDMYKKGGVADETERSLLYYINNSSTFNSVKDFQSLKNVADKLARNESVQKEIIG